MLRYWIPESPATGGYLCRVPVLRRRLTRSARTLEDEIVSGAIPPGQVLRQEHVCERFRSQPHARSRSTPAPRGARPGHGPAESRRAGALDFIRRAAEAFLIRAELEGGDSTRGAADDAGRLARLDAAETRFRRADARAARADAQRDLRIRPWWSSGWPPTTRSTIDLRSRRDAARGATRQERTTQFHREHVWSARGELDDCFARKRPAHRAIAKPSGRQRRGRPDARARARALVGQAEEAALDLAAARTVRRIGSQAGPSPRLGSGRCAGSAGFHGARTCAVGPRRDGADVRSRSGGDSHVS